jgi:hypothetical protein
MKERGGRERNDGRMNEHKGWEGNKRERMKKK